MFAHAEAGSTASQRLRGSSRRARLTLRRSGGAARGTQCAPRRLRAGPAARARPHGSDPCAAARPRDAGPSAAKLLRARGPRAAASVPAPTPGSEARAPLGRPRPRGSPRSLPAPRGPRSALESPPPRGLLAGGAQAGAGLLPGTAIPRTPPPPDATTRAKSVRAPRPGEGGGLRRGWRASGCTAQGGDGAALSLARITTRFQPGSRLVSPHGAGGGGGGAVPTSQDPAG